MNTSTSLLVNSGSGASQIVSLSAGKPIKIKIQSGSRYVLKNADNDFAPENVTLQRNGDDLLVILKGDEEAAIVIEDYYVSGNDSHLLGMAEDGQLYQYMVTDGSAVGDSYLIDDGSFAPVALGGTSLGSGAYLFEETEENDFGFLLDFWPWFLGAAVVGGGVIAKVIHDQNKDDHHDSEPVPAPAPTEEPDTTAPARPGAEYFHVFDDVGQIQGEINNGGITDDNKPEITGSKSEPGSVITIYLNGKAIGSTTADNDGNWSFTPSALADGHYQLTVTETDKAGNTSAHSPTFDFDVDTAHSVDGEQQKTPDAYDDVGNKTGVINSGDQTDDTRPEFSGTGKPGNIITVTDGDEVLGSTTVNPDGTWTFTPEVDLGEGDHSISSVETDPAGNVSKPSDPIEIVVDSTPPGKPESAPSATDNVGDKTGPINPGDQTDDTRPELGGNGTPGNVITITDGDEELGTTVVDENGNWTFTPEEDLSEGPHEISTTETDPAGNVSEPSDPIEIVVDTTPPATPDSAPSATDNVGDKTGAINSGDETDDTRPELSGTGEAGDTITIIDSVPVVDENGDRVVDENGDDVYEDVILGTTTVDENGNWTFTPEDELTEGEHNISTTETDPAGNTTGEKSDPIEIVVDTTPPAKPDSAPNAEDNVGDKTGAINSGDQTDDRTPELSGTGEAGDTITIIDTDENGNDTILGTTVVDENGNWTFTPEEELTEGEHNISTTETDPAGNTSEKSDPIEIVVDTTPPAKPDSAPGATDNVGDKTGTINPGDSTDDRTPELSGTGEAGDTITIIDTDENGNDTILGTTVVDENGNWTFTPEEELTEGEHNISTTETDPAGNTSEKSDPIEIVVDTTPPAKPDSAPNAEDNVGDKTGTINAGDQTDDTRPELSGTGEAGDTITIIDTDENGNDTILGTTTVDENGNWTFTPEEDLAEGEHNISTTETDPAGNTSEKSDPIEIVVDTTPPAKPDSAPNATDNVGDKTGTINAGDETDDTRPELSGTGEAGDIITIIDTDENGDETILGTTTVNPDGTWTFTPEEDLVEGEHNITTTETDPAGNVSEPSDPIQIVVDSIAPDAPSITNVIESDANTRMVHGKVIDNHGSTNDDTPTLSGIAEKGSVVHIYNHGDELLGSVVADKTTGQWTFTSPSLAEGDHLFHVTSTDTAGNVSEPSAEFHLVTDYTAADSSLLAITGVDDQVGAYTGNVKSGEYTDDSRPTISGTGTAGDTIIIYTKDQTGNHVIGSATVDSDGNWSMRPETPLAKGNNEFTAVEIDPVGNATDPSNGYLVIFDNSKPQQPVIERIEDNVGETHYLQKGEVTDDNTPTISGTAVANGIVTIYNNGAAIGSVQVDAKGNWEFTPSTPLADGTYHITADALNPVGQVSDATGEWIFSVDTTAPAVVAPESLTITDNVGEYQGALTDGMTTDDSTPTWTGKAEPNGKVTIYNGSQIIGSAVVDDNGDWSFTPSSSLADGSYQFTTTVTDIAGNTGAHSPIINITIDTSVPSISLDRLVDDEGDIQGDIALAGVTDDTRPEIIGTSKAGSIVKVYDGSTLLGSTIADADGNWSFTPVSDLGQGKHTITATAKDLAGNITAPTSGFEFTIDTTQPVQPTIESAQDDVGSVQGPLTNGSATDDPTPTLSGHAEKGSIVKVYDGDALLGSVVANSTTGQWSYTPTSPLGEGEHKFHVTSTDKAGNESLPSADFVLTTDFTGPDSSKLAITSVIDNVGGQTGDVAGIDPVNHMTDDTRPTIHGTGTAGDTIIVYTKNDISGEHEIGRTTVGSDGTWELRPETPLAKGENTLTAVEMDSVGNATAPSGSYMVNVDPGRPNPPVIESVLDNVNNADGQVVALQKGDVTDDNTPTLKGTAVAGGTVTFYNNGIIIGTAIVDGKGNWEFTPSPLADGTYHIKADVVDSIGRTSDQTGEWNFTVDTTAPAVVAPESLTITDNVGEYQGILRDGMTTDDSTPTWTGKAEPNGKVTIYNGSQIIGSADVKDDGSWSFTPSSALPDGNYQFTTTVTDKAGNTGAHSPVINITIDTNDVTVSLDRLVDNIGSVTGNIDPNGVTDDTRPEITGTGKVGSVIHVYDGKTELGSTTVNADGSWSFTPTYDLAQGQHTITVTATDKSGNTTDPTSGFVFNIDTTAPVRPTIDSVEDDVGSIQGKLGNGSATDDPTPTLSGSAEKGSIVKVYDGDALLGSVVANSTTGQWSYTPTSPLGEGEHKFHVTSTDAAGNESLPSADFVLEMDFTAPDSSKLAITSVIDNVGGQTGDIAGIDPEHHMTDDTRPTIHGTGTAGDTIRVYTEDANGKHEIGSTTVGKDGTWSLRPETPLVKGENILTVKEVDSVGNAIESNDGYMVNVDPGRPNPPVIESVLDNVNNADGQVVALQKGDVTDDNTPTLKGTAVANGIVTIYNNGVAIGSAQVDAKGNWEFTPSTPLADATYHIKADVVDSIGRTSDKTGEWNFSVDTSAPSVIASDDLSIMDNVGEYQGKLLDGMTTDDSTPTWTGKAEPNGKVTIYNGSQIIGSADVDGNGNWSFTPSSSLPDGNYRFTATVTDKAGNTGAHSPVINIAIDTTGLTVSLDRLIDDVGSVTGNIAPNGVTDDTRPEITGTGKVGSIIKVYDGSLLLGSTVVNADKSWSFTPASELAQGQHTITVTATDLSGNTTPPASGFVFNIDTTAPVRPTIDSVEDDVGSIQGKLGNGSATDDPTPTLAGSAEKGSIVKVYDGDALLGSVVANSTTGQWSYTPTSPLGEGEHKFHVTSTDKAGNESLPSADFVLTTDFTGPDGSQLAITSVIDNVGGQTGDVAGIDPEHHMTDDTRPTIHGTGTAGDTIIVYTKNDISGEHEIGRTTVGSNGQWELRPEMPLAKGENTLTAVEMDSVGNATAPSGSYMVNVDPGRPQPPVIESVLDNVGDHQYGMQKGDVTDDNTPTLKGTAVAGGTVTFYNNGVIIGTALVDGKGNWEFTPSPLADATYHIKADVVDSIGRTSDQTGEWSFIVDTTPPSVIALNDLSIMDNVGEYQGKLTDGMTTDDSTPTWNGKAEANGKVTIYNGSQIIGSADVDGNGNWSFTPSSALPDGNYQFTATVTDKAGNTGAHSPVINIIIDTNDVTVSLDRLIDNVGTITGNIVPNGVTDDTRPEITGTGKVGSIIKVYDGSLLLGSTVVNADKSWSFTPVSELAQGQHTITVTATDLSGNATPPTSGFVFNIDTTAPVRPTIDSVEDDVGSIQGKLGNGSATDDPTPTLSGSAEKGSIVKVYDGDALLGSVVANSTTGQWSYTPTSPLGEGEHKFHATSTDAAGNESLPSADFVLTTDFTVPDGSKLAITSVIDNVGGQTGDVASIDPEHHMTDDARPTIHGTGTAGDTIRVYTEDANGKHEIGSTTVGSDGTWSLRPETPLVKGENKLTAVESDTVGNATAPSGSYMVNVDPGRPNPPSIDHVDDNVNNANGLVVPLQKGDVTDDNTPTFNGTAVANGTVTFYNNNVVIGTAIVDGKGNWSFTPAPLADGTYHITADVVDSIGRTSDKTGEWNLTVDTTAPSALTPNDLSIMDNVGSYQGKLTDGMTTDDSTPTWTGKAEPNGKVTIYNGSQIIGSADVDGNGNWSFTPSSALPDGNYQFTTTVTDKAGNTGAHSPVINITVDTVDVTVSITKLVDDVLESQGQRDISQNGITNDTRPEIIGSGKVGSIIKIYDGSSLLGSTVVNADKSWSFTPISDMGQGKHSLTATATDQSGNTSAPTSVFEFTVDTVAPSTPTIESAHDDVGSVQGDLSSGRETDDPTPTLTGKAEIGSIVTIYDGDALLGSVVANSTTGQWSYTPTTPLGEGEHKFHVTATDAAGNVSMPSADFVLTTDFTGPDSSKLAITSVFDDVGQTGDIAQNGETDDTCPTIRGTGTAGDIIIVSTKDSNGTHVIGSTTVGSNGQWELTPETPLAAGSNEFTAVERDPAGNATDPSDGYIINVETGKPNPPVIDTVHDNVGDHQYDIQKDDVIDDNTPTLKGSAVANGIVTIYNNGTAIGSAQVDAKGNWEFTPSTPLADGTHHITANVVDTIGRASDPTGDWSFTVDTTAPSVVAPEDLKIIDNVGDVTGQLRNGDTTDDSTPTWDGKAEPNSIVTIYNGSQVIGSAQVNGSGSWSFTPSSPLPDGNYQFTTTVTDKAGNTGAHSPVINIIIDTADVTVSITQLLDDVGSIKDPISPNGFTDDTRPEIIGTGKAGSVIHVYDGNTELGSTTVKSDGSWSFTPVADMGQGKHSVTATATDKSGNTSAPTSEFEFTVDTVAPTRPTIDSAKDDVGSKQPSNLTTGSATDDPTPTLTGNAEPGSKVTIYDGDALLGTVMASESGQWTFTPTSPLNEGEHKFHVTATDTAGNVSLPSADFVLTLDFTPPDSSKLAITSVFDDYGSLTGTIEKDGVTDDARPTINGTGTAGDTITVYVKDASGDHEIGSTTVDASGKWSFTPAADLAVGNNEFTVVETDPVGNSTAPSGSYAIVVDTGTAVAPTINAVEDNEGPVTSNNLPSGSVTDDSTPTIKGTGHAGDTVTISNNGMVMGTALVDNAGNWSFTPSVGLADGQYTFTAVAKTPLGQISESSSSFVLTVDTVAPGMIQNLTITDNEGDVKGALKDGSQTDDKTPTFSGTAEGNSIVTIYDDGVAIGSVKASSAGDWSYTPAIDLADGQYKFSVTATDAAGNTSIATPVVNITIDTGTLSVSIDKLVDDIGAVQGNILNNGFTDDLRPEISGSCSKAGSTITVFIDGVNQGTATVASDGKWSFTPVYDLGQGNHSVTATVLDQTGHTADSNTFSFDVDNIAPATPTLDGAIDDFGQITGTLTSGSMTDDNTPTLVGTAEAGSIVNIYAAGGTLIGTASVDSTGKWSYELPVQADGHHEYYVIASDAAGNASIPTPNFALTIDTQGPGTELAIQHVIDNEGLFVGELASGTGTDDNRPELKGIANEVGNTIIIYATDENGVQREVGRTTVDNNREWDLELAHPLDDGTYKFTAVEMDSAGNRTAPTPDFELTIDTSLPVAFATIANMTDDVGPTTGNFTSGVLTDDSKPTLNGFISGALAANDKVVIFEKSANGVLTALGQATMIDSTRWSFDIPPNTLVGGNEHTYVAAVSNKIGNVSTPSADFELTSVVEINRDTTLDNTPVISGRLPYELESGSYMEVQINGKTYNSLTGDVVVDTVNLTWYVQIPDSDALAPMTYDVAARVVSGLGGTSDKTFGELVIAPTPAVNINVDGVEGDNKGTALTMNSKGGWQIFTNQAVLDSSATSNSSIGEFGMITLTPNTGGSGRGGNNLNLVQNATFVDYDRDGDMDIIGMDSRYSNGQQMFINNGNGTYTAVQMADSYAPGDGLASTRTWFGGVAAIDLKGDGYIDILVGDRTPNDAGSPTGTNTQIVMNEGGTFIKDDWYTWNTRNGGKNSGNATFDQEISGVDLDNNGTLDVVFHATSGTNKIGAADGNGATSSDAQRLVVAKNDGDGKLWTSQIMNDVFLNRGDTNVANAPSMTWSDFNNDGYMDLFLGASEASNDAGRNLSTIYFNDGHGNLQSTNVAGIGTATGVYKFNDNVLGGASLAVDWNGDGKMDIIEAPRIGNNDNTSGWISGTINMYTNTSIGSIMNYSTSYLQNNSTFGASEIAGKVYAGGMDSAGNVGGNPVTGMLSLDLDYDGAKDLLIFTSKGETTYVHNDNKIANGTSLHLRIVDAEGLTSFYGNTVQLINSQGKVVATQIINPQAGEQTNDSSSIVDFYGLDPNETYSVAMLRNVNKVSQDIGGIALVGSNIIENVNAAWTNIKAGAANEAHILTAESGSNVANTKGGGIVGTGYNDTLYATQGTKHYEGGGGTTEMSNYKTWTETGGMDILDYKAAGNTNLTIDMSVKTAQNTGWNTITMSNIEGLAGSTGNDTFTDDKGNNVLEGRAGNDTFILRNGGRDTLLYKTQAGALGDNRGGNGSDVVKGFTLGAWEATPNADRIDVGNMLEGYTSAGGARWINGVATMAVGETIGNYLKVVVFGDDTRIYIDRDGNGGAFGSELLVTLEGVKTDLVTLLANHQFDLTNDAAGISASAFNALTQMFTAGNDIMIGTEQQDILIGGLGNDTFTNISTNDQVSGGEGNDVIRITSTDFGSISGDAGIDTLVMDSHGELLDLSALADKLNSVEVFDMGDGGNTINVSLGDVLTLGSEELAINSGNKAIMINGEDGSKVQLDSADGPWTMSQSNYQHEGNTYNVWTVGTSGVEVLIEDTVQPVIM
ncbi:MAG: Ig-like domain-containing protein [Enterobacteriaceae bacterium]|jgi:hypothetical protein|nr:Ig-like domain-containing protein [Enterobacteriaceae bacterium]